MNSNNNEPIVLGELKKEKSSKPFFVFLVFALVLATCFGLPYIQDYLVNGEGPIVDFYNKLTGNEVVSENNNNISNNNSNNDNNSQTTTTKTIKVDESLTLLKSDTTLNLDNVYLQDISIVDKSVSYKIMASSSMNLDEMSYYLEIYDNNGVFLGRIKLYGNIGTISITQTSPIEFNTFSSYYVKLVKLENIETN